MKRLNGVVSISSYAFNLYQHLLGQVPPFTRKTASSSKCLRFSSSSSPSIDFFVSTNKKITHLIRTDRIAEAREVFDKTEVKNTVTWNTMLSGHLRRKEIVRARKLFDEMPQKDIITWNTMLSGYISCGLVEKARRLLEEMPERDFVSWNTMISGYARNGRMDEALRVFEGMPERNVVSWNAIVSGFLWNSDVAKAIEFFRRMPERDAASLSALVSGMIKNGGLDEAATILMEFEGKDNGKGDLVHAYNTLIAGYGQNGRVEEARRLFDQIPSSCGSEERGGTLRRNVVSWNSMIMCYVKAGDVVSARELFDQMKERDTFTWNTIISGYVHMSNMEEASDLFGKMPNPDTLSWNIMVSGYAQLGKLEVACDFFERMPQKNLVSWNSIIAAYDKNKCYKGAAEIFIRMQVEGQKPDRHTLSSLLSASTGLVNLQLGMQIHQLVSKTVIPDLPINNSLITMYSRCGAIIEARTIFNEIKLKRDAITWNAMIGGYASHGYAGEALSLFRLMKSCMVRPTYITFISVLNVCAHAGLVDEAQKHFRSMVNEYNIEPRIEHYASLVDMIGRYGQLEEALELIKSMPFEPDNAIWGALLGACRVHNNVELARVAAEALMKLEPESSAAYVLLYNMYADMERWEDAAEVRMLMEKNKIKKMRASSWVDSSQPYG